MGWARLLDPRQEVMGFIGRENKLAALAAWCEDDLLLPVVCAFGS